MQESTERAGTSGLAFVTTRPVAVFMFMVSLVVFGWVSLGKLPMDLLPEISYPTLTVRTAWPGAAPEDVEDRVSVRLQETLATLPDLVRTSSISRVGYSDVVLEYQWGTDMTFAVQDVRDKLDSVVLPRTAERPLILRYDPNLDPILRIGVKSARDEGGDDELIHLRWIAENKLKRELESLVGVAAVQVRGGLEEEIRVRLDPYKLSTQSIDPGTVATRLAQENLNASGGQIREGSTDFLVRTLNEFRDLEEIRSLPIVRRGDTEIRLRDIASVTRTHKKRDVVMRMQGGEAVEVAIFREAGANIVQVADEVKGKVIGTDLQRYFTAGIESGREIINRWENRHLEDYLAWRLRKEVGIEVLSDQSTFIRAAIEDVKQAAILGALLAVAVMWLFLKRASSTMIVALAIPISVLVTFAPMYLGEVSLNIMSLGGLALGVGMLVDNAIVVLESISRCREEGDALAAAALRGVREVAGAIVASTLTTVAVFAPIVFVHGVAGQIFGDQALTVVASLLVSLLVAVLFIPMLASRKWLAGEGAGGAAAPEARSPFRRLEWTWSLLLPNLFLISGRTLWLVVFALLTGTLAAGGLLFRVGSFVSWPVRRVFDTLWRGVERGYSVLLRGALAHPWIVLLLVGGLSTLAYQRIQRLGVELLPEIHQGEFTAHVGLGVESPLRNTDEVLGALERRVRAIDGVGLTALTVGVEEDTLTREIEGEHTARLTVRLEASHRDYALEERVLGDVRRQFEGHPEVRSVDVSRPTPFALDAPIAVEVTGYDLERMGEVAADVGERLSAIPELDDVRSTVRLGHPEARVAFDRDKTLEYGLDLAAVSSLVRDQLLGNVSTRFVDGDDRIDIRVSGDERFLSTLDEVLSLTVNPASMTPVPLNSIAEIELVRGPAEIRRIGNTRAMVISAAGRGLDLGGLNTRVEAALADMPRPDEVFVELGGQKRELEAGMSSMRYALLLAIFLVYVVMASQFESLVQPLIIMVTVPLAGVGVVFALDLLGLPLSVIVFIGLILLAGIVVNNAIVLVDRINKKRAQGLPCYEAILDAGHARLRPIIMTTATTALGLLPLTGWLVAVPVIGSLGSGEGGELRAPMAITVICGLVSSTLLTLVVIPVVYRLVSRLQGAEREVAA